MSERFPLFTIRISRLYNLIQKLKTSGMGRFGLKGVDTLCLYQLGLHGAMGFAEIAQRCDLDPALISRTLSGLTRKGMVLRDGAPGKYKALYSLTDQGRVLTEKISAIISNVQARADRDISPQDLVTFYRVLDRLTVNFEEIAADPAQVFHQALPEEVQEHEHQDHH